VGTNRAADDALMEMVRAAAAGDDDAWRDLLDRFHARLRRLVKLRMDPRVMGRLDPSDVLQDTYMDAREQLPAYLADPKYPFFLWLRLLTGNRLNKLHRFHLGQQVRDVTREVPLLGGSMPEASSTAIAAQLLGRDSEPPEHAAQAEIYGRVVEAVNGLDVLDREVLALRHFERLSTAEIAEVLGITVAAARKRYLRALARLRAVIGTLGEVQ
jgi:RNA polymerase sigma-70 factor (ECF subfamily)